MSRAENYLVLAVLCCAALVSFEGPATESEPSKLLAAFKKIEALSEAGEFDPALELSEQFLRSSPLDDWRRELELDGSWFFAPLLDICDPWLEYLSPAGVTANERAALYYLRGVVLNRRELELAAAAADEPPQETAAETARDAFERAIALAQETGIQADAGYNIGTLVLLVGEDWRSQIPEISGLQAAPVAPPGGALPPGAMAATTEPELDPLEQARAAYLEALELFAVRLRLDWRDADTRANLELCLRRLEELEDIERQREEQQQEKQQQEQQDQDQDQQSADQQDQNSEDEPAEGEKPPEKPPDEPQPPEESETPEEPEAQEPQQQPAEQFLTREEVQRLLDKLKAHEQEGEDMRDRMRQNQRQKTKRDW